MITTQPWSSHKHGLSKHARIKRRLNKESFARLIKKDIRTQLFSKRTRIENGISFGEFSEMQLVRGSLYVF